MPANRIAESTRRSEDLRRRLKAAQDGVRRSLPAPSEVTSSGGSPAQVQAAKERLMAALDEAEREVREQLAREWEPADRAWREQRDAEQAAAAERERAEREAAERVERELPADVADELLADDEVADLERRIAGGDEAVTAEQLTGARERAAGRLRFARLREVADERRRRREAEQAERERVERATANARKLLGENSEQQVAEAYDECVAAVRRLLDVAADRRNVVAYLARARGEDALPGARPSEVADGCAVVLDEVAVNASASSPKPLLDRALRNAGALVGGGGHLLLPTTPHPDDVKVPGIVERGRAVAAQAASSSKRRKGDAA